MIVSTEFRNKRMVDRSWDGGRLLERQTRIVRRIWTPDPPAFFPAYRVAKAAETREILSRICEMFIAEPAISCSPAQVAGRQGLQDDRPDRRPGRLPERALGTVLVRECCERYPLLPARARREPPPSVEVPDEREDPPPLLPQLQGLP